MRHTIFLLTVGIFFTALSPAWTRAQDVEQELRQLRAENKLLKSTVAQRDKTIEALKKEIETLKEANRRLEELSKGLSETKPVQEKGMKVTDSDLTPESVKKTDYRGAELLLDGYVVITDAKEGEFRAIIAAGSEGPGGDPVMVLSTGRLTYQIQVRVTGEIAATLRAGDISRRVRGIIREIKVEKGDMFRRTGLSYVPQTTPGILIIVDLDKATIR